MADEGFFSRWSRRKVEAKQDTPQQQKAEEGNIQPPAPANQTAPAPLPAAQPPVTEQAEPQLTLEDVAKLTHESDFSPFMARGVDAHVKRSAMKKLFSDPHFNVMDGLDIYIDDYNKFEPIPPEMLATLNHAKSLLDPLSQLEKPLMPMSEKTEEPGKAANEDEQQAATAQEPESKSKSDTAPTPHASDAGPAPEQQTGASAATNIDETGVDPTQHPQVRT
jgi:hypothetical protein